MIVSILFICTYNACRSKIAEAICRKFSPDTWKIDSVGTNPSACVDPKAVEILHQHQLAMNSMKPKGFQELPSIEWDFAVILGKENTNCKDISAKNFIEWDISDPQDGPIFLYESLYQNLRNNIYRLVQTIQKHSLAK